MVSDPVEYPQGRDFTGVIGRTFTGTIRQVSVDLAGEMIADDEAALRKLMAQQ